jgi:hypothetical protein
LNIIAFEVFEGRDDGTAVEVVVTKVDEDNDDNDKDDDDEEEDNDEYDNDEEENSS